MKQRINRNISGHASIPPELEQVYSSGRFLNLGEDELDGYAVYVSCKVQWELYMICRAEGMDRSFSWEDFIRFLRSSHILRELAADTVERSMSVFLADSGFDFDAGKVALPEDELGDNCADMYAARIFDEERGRALLSAFLYRVEVSFFLRKRALKQAGTWEDYLSELRSDRNMWEQVHRAYRKALISLDFKSCWYALGIRGLWQKYMELPETTGYLS